MYLNLLQTISLIIKIFCRYLKYKTVIIQVRRLGDTGVHFENLG